MLQLINREDGYFSLSTGGIVLAILLTAAAVLLASLFREKQEKEESRKESHLFVKRLVFCAAALAFGFAASYVKLIHMPWGGSVTLCSMLFITLIGYWYGLKTGLTAAFAYGLLQFIQGGTGYILSPLQVCFDYLFAFTALGLSGLFHKKKNGLLPGYLLGILLRGLFHSIGGYMYWMDYMPENFPSSLAFMYPIAYNYAYILTEGTITIVILMVPAVREAMKRVKKMALE